MIYLRLFISFIQIGLFSFGGGYAALPLIQNQVVDVNGWLTVREFGDLLTISQMTPGPIAINAATFVGMKIAGAAGAAAATLGCILPSCIIVTLLAVIYFKYKSMGMMQGILGALRPAVVAMIASAGISVIADAVFPEGLISFRLDIAVIFIVAIILLRVRKMGPVAVMLICGAMEIAWSAVSCII